MPSTDPGPCAPGYAYCIVHSVPAFCSPGDFASCLEDLAEQRKLLDVRVFAYCLINFRILLVAQPECHGDDLRSLVETLVLRHARRCNLAPAAGVSMQSSSGCRLDTDELLLSACRYVELTPVREALAERPEDWPWSSYAFRAGYAHHAVCLDPDAAYLRLGESDGERQLRYREFVAAELSETDADWMAMLVRAKPRAQPGIARQA